MTEQPATRTARELVAALVGQGVGDVVLCPGSRSAPLAYALGAAERAGWLSLHVRADERSAAFLALGLTRSAESARPAAVVTTSGTAVANLHPAVLEAAHAGRPLLVLTADRPHELRGTGANQTTEQVGIFGSAVRWSADVPAGVEQGVSALAARAVAAALGWRTRDPGPVHLNVGLREPLVPAAPWLPGPAPQPHPRVEPTSVRPPAVVPAGAPGATHLAHGPRTVVVAGDGAGPDARLLAEAAGWPLLAEPTSGARGGPAAVPAYRLLLGVPELAGAVERVVVVGRPTLSRPVSRLLAREDVEIVVVAPEGARWTDVAGTASVVCAQVSIEPARGADHWATRWSRAGEVAAGALERHLAAGPVTGLTVARAVASATERAAGGAATLVVGASMAVRDLDLASPAGAGRARVLANRGLAGIDGTISTAAGVALGSGRPVRALVGDLTFLHDLAGLGVGPLEREPDLQVVVVNDDGGAIFATLEHGSAGWDDVAERVFGTPHGADLGSLTRGYGAAHRTVRDRAELGEALDQPVHGRGVVEVLLDRHELRRERALLASAVQEAVRRSLEQPPSSGAGG